MEEKQVLFEEAKRAQERLVEKWAKLPGKSIRGYGAYNHVDMLEGVDDRLKGNLAVLYENTLTWLNKLEESTRSAQVGSFEKHIFPVLRAMLANLIVEDIVTVSPLTASTGVVFYFDVLAGNAKGNIAQGSKLFDYKAGPSRNYHYSDEVIENEAAGTGDGATTRFGLGAAALAYIPIRPGTVVFTDGTVRVTDDGNGNLVGNIGAGNNTINYATGVFDVTFSAAPVTGTQVDVSYEYNSEANTGIPEIDIQLTSAPVTARPYKLRARWSIEAQQDAEAYHGIDLQADIDMFMGNEIAKEINYKIVNHLYSIAAAGAVTWDRTPPAGVQWYFHKQSLYDELIRASNLIFAATQRAMGKWIVGSVGFCNVAETLAKFDDSDAKKDDRVAGVQYIGKLGSFKLYKDPTLTDSTFLMGYKGQNWLDTGYIWAPYLGLFTTGAITLEDMVTRMGLMQRAGLKVINANMYATGEITQTGGAY